MKALWHRLEDFFFPAVSDTWLAILRVGLGIQIVVYCCSLFGEPHSVLSFTNRDLTEAILTANSPLIPRTGWLVAFGMHLGLKEGVVLTAAWSGLLVAGCFLIAGLFCRTASITGWFLYLCAAKSGSLAIYGVDNFTVIGLFYLILAPHPDRYALDRKIWNIPIKDPHLHGLLRRMLQLHLCVIYFIGGVSKALGSGWWNGETMWRALTRPPFDVVPSDVLLSWSFLLPVAGIVVCLLETTYPFLIWPERTRPVCLVGIVVMHIAIGFTMGLYPFALIMIVLNLAAFGPEFLFRHRPTEDPLPATTT